jgi:uncharacterized ParB-like nuclease family protein
MSNYSFIIYKVDRDIREKLDKGVWGKSKASAGRTHRIPSIGERLKKKVIPQWNRRFVESIELPVKDIKAMVADTAVDKEKVKAIAESIKSGKETDPIYVREDVENKGKWLVTDGNHRLLAHKLLGKSTIKVDKSSVERGVNNRKYLVEVRVYEFQFDPNSTENEGRFRVRDPDEFKGDTIRSWERWGKLEGDGIRFITGDLKSGDKALQAVRFDKSKWMPEKANDWLEKNSVNRVSVGEFK